jgi:hypothetical protein
MAPKTQQLIRVEVDETLVSPLKDLLPLVPGSMVNVAPERRDQLVAELQGVEFRIIPDRRWVAHYQPAERLITLSFRVVELLWCVAYAYIVLFEDVYATRSPDDRAVVDLTAAPVVREAMTLLHWALQDWLDNAETAVPALPNRTPRLLGSHAAVADELCLIATAFILHHELAHHRLKHEPVPPNTQDEALLALSLGQERDADAEAADWILSGVEFESRFFTKRAAGSSVALMAIAAYGIHSQRHGGQTHPRRFDRLFNTLDRYAAADPNHPAWVFATVALKLHLDQSDYAVPAVEYESFRECISAYVDVIAEAERAREAGH